MRTIVAGWMTLLVAASAAAASPDAGVSRIDMTWSVDLAADGRIERLDLRGKWPDDLRGRLENEIRTWRFVAGRVDGMPAPTRTNLHLALRLTRGSEGAWQANVERASTGGTIRHEARTVYPDMAARGAREGLVILRVTYDERGKVVEARVADGSPVRRGSLVGAARSAVKRFEIEPEQVGGRPIAGQAQLPICFSVSRGGGRCTWRRAGSDELLEEGAALVFETQARIESEVVGREF